MIEQITINEIPSMIGLAEKFFAECKLPGSFNREVSTAIWRALMLENLVEVWVDYEAEKIVGAAGILFGPDLNTGDLNCNELFWYVFPEYRGKTSGLRLFFTLMNRAKARGARFITMAALASSPSFGSVCKLYEKTGFQPLEVFYRKDLWQSQPQQS